MTTLMGYGIQIDNKPLYLLLVSNKSAKIKVMLHFQVKMLSDNEVDYYI